MKTEMMPAELPEQDMIAHGYHVNGTGDYRLLGSLTIRSEMPPEVSVLSGAERHIAEDTQHSIGFLLDDIRKPKAKTRSIES